MLFSWMMQTKPMCFFLCMYIYAYIHMFVGLYLYSMDICTYIYLSIYMYVHLYKDTNFASSVSTV